MSRDIRQLCRETRHCQPDACQPDAGQKVFSVPETGLELCLTQTFDPNQIFVVVDIRLLVVRVWTFSGCVTAQPTLMASSPGPRALSWAGVTWGDDTP